MTSLKPFANKVIAVSGAASGTGLAIAQHLADRGAILSLADVQHRGLETAVAVITAQNPDNKVISTTVDVSKSQEVKEWISRTVEQFGRLDGAANLAGVSTKNNQWNSISDTDDDVWDFVIDINLKGTIYSMREQLKVLNDGGSIVNASVAGFRALPSVGCAAYVASKHGIIGATKAAAYEYEKKNIRVNCICPGGVEILIQSLKPVQDAGAYSPQPIARIAKLEDIDALVAYLLGAESAYITGTAVMIDGGWTA